LLVLPTGKSNLIVSDTVSKIAMDAMFASLLPGFLASGWRRHRPSTKHQAHGTKQGGLR
jgi:hypothetical protein